MTEHTIKSFDLELSTIESEISDMAALVVLQLNEANEALMGLDEQRARHVIEDDRKVNNFDLTVENAVHQVLARRAPTAKDLRLLLGLSRVSTDLERMGDEVRNIARSIVRLSAVGASCEVLSFRAQLFGAIEGLVSMIGLASVALFKRDSETARLVIARDAKIDAVYVDIVDALLPLMRKSSHDVDGAISLIWMAKSIERIGDHAKNIAEASVFIADGVDIRHDDVVVSER